MSVSILHNPRCSKSRATLALLEERDVEPDVIFYLQSPPDETALRDILSRLDLSPRQLMRKGESEYRDNNLSDEALTEDQLIAAMLKWPILIERPIVLANNKAAIGRPPECVLDIL